MTAPGEETKRAGGYAHPVNQVHVDEATFGERLADRVATGIGSWRFLIIQSFLIALWVALNIIGIIGRWDPYPFILLNLCFSLQAAYTGPVLLVANNRSAQLDRLRLEHTAEVEDAAEKMTIQVLEEIQRNTEATVKILERIKDTRSASR
ncbi:MAG TPA: DUF1003 domain-containing protein [Candidatus Dormibacteraeota bacterium]